MDYEQLLKEHKTMTAAAKVVGIERRTFRRRLDKQRETADLKVTLNASTGMIHYLNTRYDTPEEAFAASKLDPAIWYIKEVKSRHWDTPMKHADKQSAMVYQNSYVSIILARKVPSAVEEGSELFLKRFKNTNISTIKPPKVTGRPHLLVLCPFDIHFGKLGWAPEVGENTSLKEMEQVFPKALKRICEVGMIPGLDTLYIPLGQDFFNFDNMAGTTEHGTPQDNDGRYAKVFCSGMFAMERMIKMALTLGFREVQIKYIPGNHDRTISFHMCRELMQIFRACPNVKFDVSPISRKYFRYGTSIIGSIHADKMREKKLASKILFDNLDSIKGADTFEVLAGHPHVRRTAHYPAEKMDDGVVIRYLSSLSGPDLWHYDHGFTDAKRAMDAIIYDKEFGYRGQVCVTLKEIL